MPNRKSTSTEEKKLQISKFSLGVSLLALVVSAVSLGYTRWYAWSDPKVSPYEPTGYAIARGLYSFPSDHIILRLEWENSGGKTGEVRYPYLKLHNAQSEEEFMFELAGETSEISTETFEDTYGHEVKRSFLLEPHRVTSRVLAFHIDDWWDEEGKNYDFRFRGGDCYDVSIGYQLNEDEPVEFPLFQMPIFGSADRLDPETGYWWDYWSIKGTSCE